MAALEVVVNEIMMPVSYFPRLLKNFCNKIKNQLVTICPELPDDILMYQDLESLLSFGNVLSDKSSIGRMHDLYALKLF
jgi:hypothetical protein